MTNCFSFLLYIYNIFAVVGLSIYCWTWTVMKIFYVLMFVMRITSLDEAEDALTSGVYLLQQLAEPAKEDGASTNFCYLSGYHCIGPFWGRSCQWVSFLIITTPHGCLWTCAFAFESPIMFLLLQHCAQIVCSHDLKMYVSLFKTGMVNHNKLSQPLQMITEENSTLLVPCNCPVLYETRNATPLPELHALFDFADSRLQHNPVVCFPSWSYTLFSLFFY